jgi:hypothetical protein
MSPGLTQTVKPEFENPLIKSYFTSLYNFSFQKADSLVGLVSKTDIGKAKILNIKANLAWWKLLSGDAIEQNLKICNANLDESIDLLSQNKTPDAGSLYDIIYAYSLKARLENYKGNRIKSIPYIYNSVGYMSKCIDVNDKDEQLYLALGLYLYFIEYVGDEYFMMNALLFSFPKGDKTKGLEYLEECAKSENEMIKTEANYFLMKIFSETDIDYNKAQKKAELLISMHPNNLVYCMENLKILMAMGKMEDARVYQKTLMNKVQALSTINSEQRNHFFALIEELQKSGR